MIRLDAQVMTRDGRAATIISRTERHVMGPYEYPILAEVDHPNEPGQTVRWHYMADGRWKSNDTNNPNDLVPFQPWKPKRVKARTDSSVGTDDRNAGGSENQ